MTWRTLQIPPYDHKKTKTTIGRSSISKYYEQVNNPGFNVHYASTNSIIVRSRKVVGRLTPGFRQAL